MLKYKNILIKSKDYTLYCICISSSTPAYFLLAFTSKYGFFFICHIETLSNILFCKTQTIVICITTFIIMY